MSNDKRDTVTNPQDKAIEAAAKALWDMANPDMTWEEAKADPTQAAFVQWDMECARHAIAAYERELRQALYAVGDRVEKHTGDYQLGGEVRGVLRTKSGKVRYVVEHAPGFLHIYSEANIRPLPTVSEGE